MFLGELTFDPWRLMMAEDDMYGTYIPGAAGATKVIGNII